MAELYREKQLTDVTLISDDRRQVKAHRIVLSYFSDLLRSILRELDNNSHPVLYLPGLTEKDLLKVLEFFYTGKVDLEHISLETFQHILKQVKFNGEIVIAQKNPTGVAQSFKKEDDDDSNEKEFNLLNTSVTLIPPVSDVANEVTEEETQSFVEETKMKEREVIEETERRLSLPEQNLSNDVGSENDQHKILTGKF